MKLVDLYYDLKPFIPRWLQLAVRRQIAHYKRKASHHVWPIDPIAAKQPDGWLGWPDQKTFALILSHDVDTAKGCERCISLMNIDKALNFKSSFNFVPEGYYVPSELLRSLTDAGFDVGVHGLTHDGKLFIRREVFERKAPRINHYLKKWKSAGFVAPSMRRNLDWIANLDIEYDCSTFDTDPFEPQPIGVRTIFPFWVLNSSGTRGYVELPYSLPQDHCLFVILKQKNIKIWTEKLDWVAKNGGVALLNTHPDYMNFVGNSCSREEYPVGYYLDFLEYAKNKYKGQYWNVLPRELARFWKKTMVKIEI